MTPALSDVPVDPTPPEAIDWLTEELSKPQYQAARPTLFDLVAKAISDWFESLVASAGALPPGLVWLVVAVLVLAVLVVLFLVFGMPRLNRRAATPGAVFGDEDGRDAAQLRRDAEEAARRGDWVTAIADRFRAIARGVADRELVAVLPGTTAHEFARVAARAFPAEQEALRDGAIAFDDVRYLSRPGDEASYRALAALDDRLERARPALPALAASSGPEPPR